MRSFPCTPHNIYAATNALEAMQFARTTSILNEQSSMIDGRRGWYPLAPDPGIAARMQPEMIYGRDGVFRDYELGPVPYAASYVSPLVYMQRKAN